MGFGWRVKNGSDDGDGENAENEAEGPGNGEVDVTGEEHFETDKRENDGEAKVQVGKEFDQASDGKVESTKAENGKGVGGEDDERIAGDGEDGGDGINGKNKVGCSEGNEYEKERGACPFAFFSKKEAVSMKVGGDRNKFSGDANEGVVVGFDLGLAPFEEFDPSVNEKGSENINEPLKAVDEGNTGKDKKSAQEEGANDSPK